MAAPNTPSLTVTGAAVDVMIVNVVLASTGDPATSVTIERSPDDMVWTEVKVFPINFTFPQPFPSYPIYFDLDVNPGETWYYHVRASNDDGDSAFSASENATTPSVDNSVVENFSQIPLNGGWMEQMKASPAESGDPLIATITPQEIDSIESVMITPNFDSASGTLWPAFTVDFNSGDSTVKVFMFSSVNVTLFGKSF